MEVLRYWEVLRLRGNGGDAVPTRELPQERNSTYENGGVVVVIVKVEGSGFAVRQKRVTVGRASSGSEPDRSYLLYHLTAV
jgi:hypothetical protein